MNRIRRLFSGRSRDREIAEEIQAHVEEMVDELVRGGLAHEEAELAARRRFGNITLREERSREVWRGWLIEELVADVRYAVRQLRSAPAFTLASILTLALGIGANTAVFSVVNAVILRPLPFPHPDRLVSVQSRSTRGAPHPEDLSYPNFFDFRSANRVFEHLVSYRDDELGLSGAGEPINLRAQIVSWDLFAALQVRPALGRGFLPDEERPGQRVVILSHQLWTERFGADASVLGRVIAINRQPYTVVGVAPQGFNFPVSSRRVQIWTTLALDASSDTVTPITVQRGARLLNAIGRLKPGVSVERARAEMDGIAGALAVQYPDQSKSVAGTYVRPEIDRVIGEARDPLLILLGAVGLVLLIACANVANLLLARTSERQREFAVRASIGAGVGRIVRQLLAESVTFALIGSSIGVFVAPLCVRLAAPLAGGSIPRIEQAGVDGAVLAFSVALAFLTSGVFSLAPALRVSRIEIVSPLKGASGTGAGGKDRLRNGLAAAQIALGLALLSGAGVLAAGFLHLMRRDAGFRTEGLLSFSVGLPEALQRNTKSADFYARLLEGLIRPPHVASAAASMPLPLAGHQMRISFNIEERPSLPYDRPACDIAIVTPTYFETLGAPLLEGRLFNERDDASSPAVLIVNRAFAEKFFPGEKVIGKRIQPGATAKGVRTGMREIIGLVGNARQAPLGAAPDPIYYYAWKQLPWCCPSVIVRSPDSPAALESAIRRVVASIDRETPVFDVHTMSDSLSAGLAGPRFQTLLLGAFAVISLLLTAVGIYGILAYSVLRRTREIGIRVALGATRMAVVAMVIKEAWTVVVVGVSIGLIGAVAGNRLASKMVYGVVPPQAVLLAIACCVIAVTAMLAAYIPARRAASIDPGQALRNE